MADRLAAHPELLAHARARVDAWLMDSSIPRHHAEAWRTILAQDLSTVLAFLVDEGERARELRQSTPFAGFITARERWAIWRSIPAYAEKAPEKQGEP